MMICVRWNASDLVERGHERRRARAGSGVKWLEVHIAPRPLRYLGDVVVAPPLGGAVRGEVLRRRGNCSGRAEIGSLKTAHARRGELCAEIRIFSRTLDDASPPRIAGGVDHQRDSPIYTHRRGADRGGACLDL